MTVINQETGVLFAKRHMSRATAEDLVAWAVSMLEAGLETKSLCILAGMTGPLYSSEVEDYFQRAMRELNISPPEPAESLICYARGLAGKILRGEIEPQEGAHEIYGVYVALDYPRDLSNWLYLDDGLAPGGYMMLGRDELGAEIRREAKSLIADTTNY